MAIPPRLDIMKPEPNRQMTEVTAKLKGLHAELEKTHRGEDKYLTLVTEEHSILKEERELLLNFQQTERRERECFSKVGIKKVILGDSECL